MPSFPTLEDSSDRLLEKPTFGPAAATPAPSIVIIGFGNPMRADDGFGWEIAERLADVYVHDRDVSVVSSFQVLPEFAEMVSGARFALFIDAEIGLPPGQLRCRSVRVLPIHLAEQSAVGSPIGTHHTTPQEVLQGARILYGHAPFAALITVGAGSLAYGSAFSDAVARQVNTAMHIAQEIVRTVQSDPWKDSTMHEFALMEGIVQQALRAFDEQLQERFGPDVNAPEDAEGHRLSPHVPAQVTIQRSSELADEVLFTTFEALTQGTPLDGALLDIRTVEHDFTCGCGFRQTLHPDDMIGHMFVCPACGAIHEIPDEHGLAFVRLNLLAPVAGQGHPA